jgi:hypothetical protein
MASDANSGSKSLQQKVILPAAANPTLKVIKTN